MRNQWFMGVALAGLALGCLRREETITVKPDGSVHVALKFEGQVKDFETADALPAEGSGWNVESKTTVEENGEVTRLLTSQRGFDHGEELPASYAPAGDPDADLYTSFLTSIHTERRKDGVYMYFRRVYRPRPWAYVNFWTDEYLDDSNKKLAEKPVEELSRKERVQLVGVFAEMELFKQLEFAQEALQASDPQLRPEAWLVARSAVIESGKEIDWGVFVDRVAALDAQEREVEFEREAQRVQKQTYETLTRTLQKAADYGEKEVADFETAYQRASKRYAVTNEVGGHNFLVRVKLPGELVAHNAQKLDEDGAVVWDFAGNAFRDRPFELIAVSRMPLKDQP